MKKKPLRLGDSVRREIKNSLKALEATAVDGAARVMKGKIENLALERALCERFEAIVKTVRELQEKL